MYLKMGTTKSKLSRKPKTKFVEVSCSPLDHETLRRIRPARKAKKDRIRSKTTSEPFQTQDQPLDLTTKKDFEEESGYNFNSIGRCSTPSNTYCDHCSHQHGKSCCLYVNDTANDKINYSLFMQFLEKQAYAHSGSPLQILPEAIAGNTTPPNFPSFTVNDPEVLKKKMQQKIQQPMLFVPQPFVPTYPIWTPLITTQFQHTTPSPMFPTSWHHIHPHYIQPSYPIYENIPFAFQQVGGISSLFAVERDLIRQNMIYSSMSPPPPPPPPYTVNT